MFRKHDSLGRNRRNTAVSRKRDADCLAQTVHAVCRIHAGAGAAARTYILLVFFQSVVVDNSRFSGAYRFKHLGKTRLYAANQSGHHRSAGAYHCRNIHSAGCHYHARNDFITVWYQYRAVESVRRNHRFHAVRNQFAACQRIFHADMSHRNSVTYADSRNHNRRAACHSHSGFYGLCDFV